MADGRRLGGHLTDESARPAVGSAVTVAIRPERLVIREGGDGDGVGWTRIQGRVVQGTYLGDQTEYRVATDALGEVIVRTPVSTGHEARTYGPGEGVDVAWHEDAVLVLGA